MKILTEVQKLKLKELIRGLRKVKDIVETAEDVKNRILFKRTGMCGASFIARVRGEISEQTKDMIDQVIKAGLYYKGVEHVWFDTLVQEMNPGVRIDRQMHQTLRHKWLNRVIRDYTKMLKKGEIP